jgi:Fic family protein
VNVQDNLRMNRGKKKYIWQDSHWPHWQFDLAALSAPLASIHRTQGYLYGRLADVGVAAREQATLIALTDEVIKTSAIEGEQLNADAVRSSIARRLGVDIGALAPVDRHVEGVVEMVLDATVHFEEPLTAERLLGWHAALFPTGYSGRNRIRVGDWRDDRDGPMQVVSGAYGRQKLHFEAPAAAVLDREISTFLSWFNKPAHAQTLPPLIKAGLSHLWLVTLHPFDDGNGRISRAVGDMALARAEQHGQRFYSLSAQIQREREDYYDHLERTQKGNMDVTVWLQWFLGCLLRAMEGAGATVDQVLLKAQFWQSLAGMPLNERQIKLINRLLDGFEGKLTSSKWAVMAKCSPDTALRDINELVARAVLRKSDSGGRSTSYELNVNA